MTKKKALIRTIYPVAWMILIFCLSNQTADESSRTSGILVNIIKYIVSHLFAGWSKINQDAFTNIAQFIVRKCAHMSLYFVLCLLVFFAVSGWVKYFTSKASTMRAAYILAFAISVIYSITDEFHQYFIPGRSCELRDVLIDSSGALIAIVVLVIARKKLIKLDI